LDVATASGIRSASVAIASVIPSITVVSSAEWLR